MPESIDEVAARYGLVRPSRRDRIVQSAPRVAQYYWVDFPHDANPPEFINEHPGIVVRAARALKDTCTIVPVTSTPQSGSRHIHKLIENPNPRYPGRDVWAVCDHLYTVNIARLRPVTLWNGKPIFPRVSKADMKAVSRCIQSAFSHILSLGAERGP